MKRLDRIEEPSRLLALVEAVLANLIWASSFVLVKYGLEYMGPLTVGGLRYFLGFLLLVPIVARHGSPRKEISPGTWARLVVLGLCAYTIGNGAMFTALKYLPATTGSLLQSQMPILVVLGSIVWLNEIPRPVQFAGIALALLGSFLFFSNGVQAGQFFGVAVAFPGMLGFAAFGLLGREVARHRQIDTFTRTAVPLAFGGGFLLLGAIWLEGLPELSATGWLIVFWLALINTALAYILYNHALEELTAFEMNLFYNLGPLVTALLAWLFLGETLSMIQITGMVIAISGLVLVQQGGQVVRPLVRYGRRWL